MSQLQDLHLSLASAPTNHRKVGRPPNSWILFRCFMLGQLKEAGHVNIPQADVSKYISQLLTRSSPEVRQYWERVALSAKADHMARFPEYKFAPKRREGKARERSARAWRKAKAKRAARKDAEIASSSVPYTPTYPMALTSEYPGLAGVATCGRSPSAASMTETELDNESTPYSAAYSQSYVQLALDQYAAGPIGWEVHATPSATEAFHGSTLPPDQLLPQDAQESMRKQYMYSIDQPSYTSHRVVEHIPGGSGPAVFPQDVMPGSTFDGSSLDGVFTPLESHGWVNAGLRHSPEDACNSVSSHSWVNGGLPLSPEDAYNSAPSLGSVNGRLPHSLEGACDLSVNGGMPHSYGDSVPSLGVHSVSGIQPTSQGTELRSMHLMAEEMVQQLRRLLCEAEEHKSSIELAMVV